MLKAVIFDLDGLLVDSTPVHRKANEIFLNAFNKVHLPATGREGMRIIDILRDYKDIYDLPGDIDDLYERRQRIFFELVKSELQFFPDAFALLEKIKKRNLKIALATSADQEYIKILYEKFPQLKSYFTVIVTGEDVERGKPYPDVFLKTLEALFVQPEEAIVIEDSVNGVIAAKRAKIPVICIPNKNYPDADYSIADQVFESLEEAAAAIL